MTETREDPQYLTEYLSDMDTKEISMTFQSKGVIKNW